MPTKGREYNEHDETESRKRVATYVDGTTVAYEDSNFTTAESPIIFDIFTDLGRLAHEGYISNEGTGNLSIEISADGTTYGGIHTLNYGETMQLGNMKVNRIRMTALQGSSYRILAA